MKNEKQPKKFDRTDPNVRIIRRSSLVWRFKFYGFFKNLRFFEPYLFIIYINIGLSLFEIGLLVAITEVFTYLFEIPSGILADSYGKKKVMIACFIFYIISFFLYFLGIEQYSNGIGLWILILASILFGLGEAFRSGTHKAMELAWMEKRRLLDYKSYIYGITRSYSLIGSALSSLMAILLVLTLSHISNTIFLFSIIPYVIDLILISTYPKYMDKPKDSAKQNIIKELLIGIKNTGKYMKQKKLRNGLISSSSFDAVFKSLKDYIQPLIQVYIGVLLVKWRLEGKLGEVDGIAIVLGLLYTIFYLISSISSKNSYRAEKWFKSPKRAIDVLWDIFGIVLICEAIFIFTQSLSLIMIGFLLVYILENMRRPLLVGYLGGIAEKDQRATVLSVESEIKSLLKMVFAPIFGLIADFNLSLLFIIIGVLFLIGNRFLKCECDENSEDKIEKI